MLVWILTARVELMVSCDTCPYLTAIPEVKAEPNRSSWFGCPLAYTPAANGIVTRHSGRGVRDAAQRARLTTRRRREAAEALDWRLLRPLIAIVLNYITVAYVRH